MNMTLKLFTSIALSLAASHALAVTAPIYHTSDEIVGVLSESGVISAMGDVTIAPVKSVIAKSYTGLGDGYEVTTDDGCKAFVAVNYTQVDSMIYKRTYDVGAVQCFEEMEKLRLEMDALAADLSCNSDAQCKAMPLGHRPCGGADGYLVYSSKNTDEKKLSRLAERFTKFDIAADKGMMSICSIERAPQLTCDKSAKLCQSDN